MFVCPLSLLGFQRLADFADAPLGWRVVGLTPGSLHAARRLRPSISMTFRTPSLTTAATALCFFTRKKHFYPHAIAPATPDAGAFLSSPLLTLAFGDGAQWASLLAPVRAYMCRNSLRSHHPGPISRKILLPAMKRPAEPALVTARQPGAAVSTFFFVTNAFPMP